MINNKNIIKEKVLKKEKCLVAWAQAASNITTEILASSGFDAILIDMEHGPGDFKILLSQIQSMNGYPTVPLVRVANNDATIIKKTLDTGAYGILIPYIETAEEAECAVQATKYPPFGIRGLAASTRAANYGNNAPEYFARANDEILVFIAIESIKGIQHLDDILQVKGVDGVFVGPADLATSMGHLGNFNIPEVQEKINYIEQKILDSGKILMSLAMNWEDAERKFNKGASLVLNMSDTTSLGVLAREKINIFKQQY